ncbi:VOC family protein [Kribbella sp. NPDC005582]|uniref:VOC family protein n=1 Tax=Kribbella sp. NPDC005582 TaxID=3156893 RepID=UPI00339EADB2
MTSRLRSVTFDAHNPYELAGFWLQVLRTERPADDLPGEPYASVPTESGMLMFEQNNDGKAGKNRLHLDLEPDGPRDEEVAWLQTLGATIATDFRNPDGTGWVVMQDPEGNEFCVLRSAAERAATS